jgi:hypothetical protein
VTVASPDTQWLFQHGYTAEQTYVAPGKQADPFADQYAIAPICFLGGDTHCTWSTDWGWGNISERSLAAYAELQCITSRFMVIFYKKIFLLLK